MNFDQITNKSELMSPEYIQAVIRQKPRDNDPLEMAIREKIRTQVSESSWAEEVIARIRQEQIGYMKEMITHVKDPVFIYEHTQAFLKKISESLRSKIVEGKEFLDSLPKGNSALVMTNHLGIYKLAGIDPKKDLGVNIPGYDFLYPSPLYFGGLNPVAEATGNNLSYVSNDFPEILGEIHRKSGFIHIPPITDEKKNRTAVLLDQTREALRIRPNTSVVNYPEGGTSGKYTGLGPYDLDPFKTGGYVIASELKIPVIATAQYFDPKNGLFLKVFPPYIPEMTDKSGYQQYADNDRNRIQDWLNQYKI